MKTDLHSPQLRQLSRRDFLKHSSTALLALFCLPLDDSLTLIKAGLWVPKAEVEPLLGRILTNRVLIYDRPSLNGKLLKAYPMDAIKPITQVTIGDLEPAYNRIWYELDYDGFAHSGSVQPVQLHRNQPELSIPAGGRLAAVSVPFTDIIWHPRWPDSIAHRLYYDTLHWITGNFMDAHGQLWYIIQDDKWELVYYGNPAHYRFLQPAEMTPLSANLPDSEKRIEINLDQQIVTAYEADEPVFMTKSATGAKFRDGDYSTPHGHFITNRKRPSRHMAAGDPAASNGYDLPGIPWVCYLTKSGISFHGTYWHNDFGKPRSHGCINLSIEAARWVYRWTNPTVPFGIDNFEVPKGTQVHIF